MRKLLAVLVLTLLAGCNPVPASLDEEGSDPPSEEMVAFADLIGNVSNSQALFCPEGTDCAHVDMRAARFAEFLTADMPGSEGIRYITIGPDPNPALPVEAVFTMGSGVTLHRVTLTEKALSDPDFQFANWAASDGMWMSDDTCVFEDTDRFPGSPAAFVNMWWRGGQRKRDVNAYLECVGELTKSVKGVEGCGLFVEEILNEETGDYDFHASILCPE
ncbi:MAG: hypothetical protein OXF01_05560 [Gemmatimonadetes bacterium]|nr:hypothetical protein [Gemmatimonadota bacterium]